ncbi:uncharacterized protein LOC108807837 [Raphanus sativus]|uniref:Uncharacterized protein LOC108807837 n=1 Tax=Raphanus sativus TaxID=3726 RepID=A0A6J0JIW3_RAPSA|nr:uncharacterized protein LOC108807837 [Raphanus sativus]
MALEWEQAQEKKQDHTPPQVPIRTPPTPITRPPSEISCFVDAAWDARSKRSGVAWRISRNQPHLRLSGTQIFEAVSSPLVAESLALLTGIKQTLQMGFQSAAFYSDCQTLTRAINCKNQIIEIFGVLHDIDHFSSRFSSISFQFVSRSQNGETDALAKRALKVHVSSLPSL